MDSIEFEGMSRQEAAKFRAWFNNEYATLYPPPKLVLPELDWKFKMAIVTSVATILLAALRTAQMFFAAAELSASTWGISENTSYWMSLGDAFVSMLSVEAGLVVISAIRSTTTGKVNPNIYKWQIAILLTISVIAGLGQSLGLIKNIDPGLLAFFSYVLSVVLGVGASFAAWFSGEVLGVLLNTLSEERKTITERYDKDTEQYQKTARRFWGEKKEQEKAERKAEREKFENRTPEQTTPRSPVRSVPRRTQNGTSEKQAIIISEYEQNKPIGPTELLRLLQDKYPTLGFASKGYISYTLKRIDSESTLGENNGDR